MDFEQASGSWMQVTNATVAGLLMHALVAGCRLHVGLNYTSARLSIVAVTLQQALSISACRLRMRVQR